MRKREWNIYIYNEIAGDAFFLGVLFKNVSGEHNHPPYSGGVNSPVLTTSPLCCSEISNNKSQAFETK